MTLTKYNAAGERQQSDALFAPQGVVMSAYANGNGAYNFSTLPKIQMDTVDFDPYGWYDRVNYRWTPKIPGYYRVSWHVFQNAWFNQGDSFRAYLGKNGSAQWSGNKALDYPTSNSGFEQRVSSHGTKIVYMNGTTDYLEVFAYSTYSAGADRTVYPGPGWTRWDANLVAASVGVAPEPWHYVGAAGEPAFQNGCTNYQSGNVYTLVSFRKLPDGTVRLRGLVGCPSGLANPSQIFTLPVGYRPMLQELMMAQSSVAAGGAQRVDVLPNGQVANFGVAVPTAGWVALSPISFMADQ